MLSQTIMIGRTTKEPDIRHTQSGVTVATFTIAVDRNYKNAQGEKETDFFNCVAWRGLGETIEKYLGKGRLVAVTGRMQNRSYETQDGTKKYIIELICSEVQFLDKTKDGQAQQPAQEQGGFHPVDDSDQELPF